MVLYAVVGPAYFTKFGVVMLYILGMQAPSDNTYIASPCLVRGLTATSKVTLLALIQLSVGVAMVIIYITVTLCQSLCRSRVAPDATPAPLPWARNLVSVAEDALGYSRLPSPVQGSSAAFGLASPTDVSMDTLRSSRGGGGEADPAVDPQPRHPAQVPPLESGPTATSGGGAHIPRVGLGAGAGGLRIGTGTGASASADVGVGAAVGRVGDGVDGQAGSGDRGPDAAPPVGAGVSGRGWEPLPLAQPAVAPGAAATSTTTASALTTVASAGGGPMVAAQPVQSDSLVRGPSRRSAPAGHPSWRPPTSSSASGPTPPLLRPSRRASATHTQTTVDVEDAGGLEAPKQRQLSQRAMLVTAAVNFGLTAYATLTVAAVKMLHCVWVPGSPPYQRRLYIRGTVVCDYGGWQAGFLILVAVLAAAPVGLALVASWARHAVPSYEPGGPTLVQDVRLGVRRSLVDGYRESMFWWEGSLMVQRLVRVCGLFTQTSPREALDMPPRASAHSRPCAPATCVPNFWAVDTGLLGFPDAVLWRTRACRSAVVAR